MHGLFFNVFCISSDIVLKNLKCSHDFIPFYIISFISFHFFLSVYLFQFIAFHATPAGRADGAGVRMGARRN